jgi:translation elongation factor EF-1alpha
VLCDPDNLIPITKHFSAKIVTFNLAKPLVADSLDLIQGSLKEACTISKMTSLLNKAGEVERRNPRMLLSNQTARVEIRVKDRGVCLEGFKASRELGRFLLRLKGVTVGAGIIEKVLEFEKGGAEGES